jgi:hypothetical protein
VDVEAMPLSILKVVRIVLKRVRNLQLVKEILAEEVVEEAVSRLKNNRGKWSWLRSRTRCSSLEMRLTQETIPSMPSLVLVKLLELVALHPQPG